MAAVGRTGPDVNQMVKFLLVGLVFLFLIMQFINFGAIGSEEDVDIFKEPPEDVVPQTFSYIIIAAAIWFGWKLTVGAEGRMDQKKFVTLIISAVALYFIYTAVLQPMLPDVLPNLGAAAVQLQSIVSP